VAEWHITHLLWMMALTWSKVGFCETAPGSTDSSVLSPEAHAAITAATAIGRRNRQARSWRFGTRAGVVCIDEKPPPSETSLRYQSRIIANIRGATMVASDSITKR